MCHGKELNERQNGEMITAKKTSGPNNNTRQTLSQIRLNYINKTISTQTIHNELAKKEAVAYEHWTVEDFKKSFGQINLLTHSFKLRVLDACESSEEFHKDYIAATVTIAQLVKEEWDAVPESYYRNLIKSMPRRGSSCILQRMGSNEALICTKMSNIPGNSQFYYDSYLSTSK
ncbi:11279_t:CDS:2 [Ambispora gerdemannii]|uniref:11279_t:CDS:1 n=1 Tax=Ambispora gerdemannii TaxID=144530 RepID=A0A9N9DQK3_9GLOM|nr:11279_t:CDS:2 [Ambispora gerdemannii]